MECFEPYGREEGQTYSRASALATELCDKDVVHLLTEIQFKVESYNSDAENVMSTEQNAYVIRNAEKYYQAMIKRVATSWNISDQHMVSTLELMEYNHKAIKDIV